VGHELEASSEDAFGGGEQVGVEQVGVHCEGF
jgi:hypothetical protein